MPFDPTTYRPDPLVVEGGNWMRNTLGLKPSQFSSDRVGDHLHMLNCMFDMVTLAAVVEPHSSGYPKVTKTSRCHLCNPPKPEPVAQPKPAAPELPWEVRNLTARAREFNINLVAVAMRAATDTEMWDLWEGYRNVLGWQAACELWRFAGWKRPTVVSNNDSRAQVARVLRAFRARRAEVTA